MSWEEGNLLNRNYLKTALLVVAVQSLQGCGEAADDHNHPELTTGKALYEFHCAECHKSTGSGSFLSGIPANKDTELSSTQVVELLRGIHRDGGESMPVWKGMSTQEAAKIATYLKTL